MPSTSVSLISRSVFEYAFIYKRLRYSFNPKERVNNDTPILLVYEEAHKYVPNSNLLNYSSSKLAIDRIASEENKYGVQRQRTDSMLPISIMIWT